MIEKLRNSGVDSRVFRGALAVVAVADLAVGSYLIHRHLETADARPLPAQPSTQVFHEQPHTQDTGEVTIPQILETPTTIGPDPEPNNPWTQGYGHIPPCDPNIAEC